MGLTTITGNIDTQPLNDNFSYINEKLNNIVFNIKDDTYGAIGNGITDDTSAIQSAIDAAINNNGGIIFFPPGTYLITSGLLINDNDIYLYGKGATLIFSGSNDIAVDFYKSGSYIYRGGIDGLYIKKSTEEWDTDTSIGIRLNTVQESYFIDFAVENFTTGLKLEGNAQGCAHNTIHIRRLFNNKINLLLTANNNGWCNENSFYGGRFSCQSGRAGGYADTINAKIEHYATYSLNNNKFFGCSFESASSDTKAIYCEGTYNFFYSCRFETSNTVEFTANSQNNVIFYGNNLFRSNITDDGARNCFYTREGIYLRGSTIADEGVLKVANGSSAAYPAISVLDPSTLAEVIKLLGTGELHMLSLVRASKFEFGDSSLASRARGLYYNVGSPEGVVTASPGAICVNGSGGAGTTLYIKESGVDNTGWVAK